MLQSREPNRGRGVSLAAGTVLALACLTTARLMVFLPLAVLWVANNSAILDFLPKRSVDEITDAAYYRLPEDRKRLMASLGDEVEVDRQFARWAGGLLRRRRLERQVQPDPERSRQRRAWRSGDRVMTGVVPVPDR